MGISHWGRWRIGRSARRRARGVLRGYRKLQASADPALVARFNERITRQPLGIQTGDCSALVYRADQVEVELAARQFLLGHCAGRLLNGKILRTIDNSRERVSAPIPAVWVRAMGEEGVRVDRGRCRISFAAFVGKRFVVGVAQILRILVARAGTSQAAHGVVYAHFVDLIPTNVPRTAGGPSYDIVSWYLAWGRRPSDITEVWQHSVPMPGPRRVDGVTLRHVSRMIPPLDLRAKLFFAAWGTLAAVAAGWDAVRGRWTSSVLLSDAARAKHIGLIADALVAREYLFSLSSAVYRPLWTYVAERRGAMITLFNYAASLHDFKTARQLPHGEFGYESMSWPRMLVWTDSYADYARARLPHVRAVERVPPIWFADADDEIPATPRPCVAVFDVTPTRPSHMTMAAPALPYRTFDIGREFLEHIYDAAQLVGYDLLWKRKRSFSPVHDKRYVRFAREFAARPGVVEVAPDTSPFRVVDASVAVISTPFTSTAFIGSSRGRPSVFYDSTGGLHSDDPAAQGVRVVFSRQELAAWLMLSGPPEAAQRSAAS